MLAAGPLGIMQACLDVVLPYVRERKQFGQPIGTFQLMQAKIADMYVALNSARAYVYAVARACDAGKTTRFDAAGAILLASENAVKMLAGSDPGAGRRGLYQGMAGRALPARRQALRYRRRHQRDPPLPDRPGADRHMTVIASLIDTESEAFRANAAHNRALADELRTKTALAALGGSRKRARQACGARQAAAARARHAPARSRLAVPGDRRTGRQRTV